MEPVFKLVLIDDITGIAIYEGGGMRLKAYPGTTHYPVPEPGSGSAILDSIVLNHQYADTIDGPEIERISKHTVPWWHTRINRTQEFVPHKVPSNMEEMFDPTVKAMYSYEDCYFNRDIYLNGNWDDGDDNA